MFGLSRRGGRISATAQFALLLALSLLQSACLVIELDITETVVQGGAVSLHIVVQENAADFNAYRGVQMVLVPNDWTFSSGAYTASDKNGAVGSGSLIEDPDWADSAAVGVYPAPVGMKWIGLISDAPYSHSDTLVMETNVEFTAGPTIGTFQVGVVVTKESYYPSYGDWFATGGSTIVGADSAMANYVTVEGCDVLLVTNVNDSDAGSLRQAILDANADPDLDCINFNIAGAGPHTIQPTSPLPTITDSVIINGYTQPGSSPNTNPAGQGLNTVLKIELDGTNAGAGVDGLHITATGSTIKGLVINRFGAGIAYSGAGINITGSGGNTVEGNFIGTDTTGTTDLGNNSAGVRMTSPYNVIGGSSPAAANLISGNGFNGVFLSFYDAHDNVVQGNLIGVDVDGTSALGNSFEGVRIVNACCNQIGGWSLETRNVISANSNGISISGETSTLNWVTGNYIGTDVWGTSAIGNTGVGISISASYNHIGGVDPGAGNLISGNASDGVKISGVYTTGDPIPYPVTGNKLLRNLIGTDLYGSDLGNSGHGVWLKATSGNIVGVDTAKTGNVIAFNGGSGVVVTDGIENPILSNLFFENVGLGIDLGGAGVSANDPGDSDLGANKLQNTPVVVAAHTVTGGAGVKVTYYVDSDTTSSSYPLVVQFFEADSDDQEGAVLSGTDMYTKGDHDACGTPPCSKDAVLTPDQPFVADMIVGTATDADGNTSEFSPPFPATEAILCQTQAQIPQAECEFLVALYDSTQGGSWTTDTHWLSLEPCSWFGVTCLSGHVSDLSLPNNNLYGPLPPSLGDLADLYWLNLGYNDLSGPLPSSLGSLSNLTYLELSQNQLWGSIPESLGNLANIVYLMLEQNDLSGPIPASFGNLSNLRFLHLYLNNLSGTIPPSLGNAANLREVELGINKLTGTIPSSLGNLTFLNTLFLGGNSLTGTIPVALARLDSLRFLYLSNNNLEGAVPLPVAKVGSGADDCDLKYNDSSLCLPDIPAYQALATGGEICRLPLDPTCAPIVHVEADAFLQGPYALGSMSVETSFSAHVPLTQPYADPLYDGTPLDYDSLDIVATLPDSVVDWVLVSLRSDINPESEIAGSRRAAFLLENGSIVDTTGGTLSFSGVAPAGYHMVVRHRNHASIMSADTLDLSDGLGSWDFTTGMAQAYSAGGNPMKDLGDGRFGMFACDVTADGLITALDFNLWNAATSAGASGYAPADCNMDGVVTAPDFNLWNANTSAGAGSKVPDN